MPPINALCSLSSLLLTVTCYVKRNAVQEAAVKLPWVSAALVSGLSVTVYSLAMMIPINNKLAECYHNFQQGESKMDSAAVEDEYREAQARWRKLNFGMFVMGLRLIPRERSRLTNLPVL